MSEKEDIFEKYRRELMEMHRKASSKQEVITEEEPVTTGEAVPEEPEEPAAEPETEEYVQEEASETENEQTDSEPSVCDLCAGGIALCEFSVEDAGSGKPIKYAQILVSRNDGLFVRALTDENGKTDEIPFFAGSAWRVSITAQGYVSVSKAQIDPVAGEKTVIPVRLDESLSLDGIFAEHDRDFLGA